MIALEAVHAEEQLCKGLKVLNRAVHWENCRCSVWGLELRGLEVFRELD